MFIESDRGGPWDVWLATRETIDDSWGEPVNLGPTVNSKHGFAPNISPDGLTLYFSSWRPGGLGQADLYVTKRASLDDPWETPINLGPNINSPGFEDGSQISSDGLTLYFTSERPGGYGRLDIWMTTRPTTSDPWTEPINLGPNINTAEWDFAVHVLSGGCVLLFSSGGEGTLGGHDLWIARRKTASDPWGIAVNLGPIINTESDERAPSIAPDGSDVYFHSDRAGGYGGFDIWRAPVFPVVDLNVDGIVDIADMVIIDHWGTDEPSCDIGPTPFGDGIVDVQDLIVLAEHLFEEVP
jgi:Tol biopolymer transport system component